MLVESLALRETNNGRALAVKHRWLDTDFIPKKSYAGNSTLTDNPSNFASGFWVQQMQFFNGDFRHSDDFQTYFTNQQQADQALLRGRIRSGVSVRIDGRAHSRTRPAITRIESGTGSGRSLRTDR